MTESVLPRLRNSRDELCVTMSGAAKLLGVSRERVRQWVQDGRLEGERHEGAGSQGFVLITLAAVDALRRRRMRARSSA